MADDIQRKIQELEPRLDQLKGFIDLPVKQKAIDDIQVKMNESNFWEDSAKANKFMKEMKYLKGCVEPYLADVKKLSDLKELHAMAEGEEVMMEQIRTELAALEADVEKIEIQNILCGPFDKSNAILSINSGAGGTESCDWANMLLRMYNRWADEHGFKVSVIDILAGEEAGIKNVTLGIEGDMVYGYLKAEKGVHRLVRISPFDANKRRHTSFASVDVIPEIEDDIEVEIKPEDLRIDIFRSSGAGGQSVNTCDSAVRLTHLPTGIVVQSQNERSQLQNKNTAMKVLKARLYEQRQKEQEEKLAKEYQAKQKIEWGSQIRSYTMQPYTLVKDHRTDAETGNIQKVMDGGLDFFMEAFLKYQKLNSK
ncbi:MAG: peptide chain release factor 2 [Candidatus Omnitrophica bacterium]|nr:peptide chain release factor 2 [Candidatus Omnitrophota bacterium]